MLRTTALLVSALLCAQVAVAQKLELGLNAAPYYAGEPVAPGVTASFKTGYSVTPRWQAGVHISRIEVVYSRHFKWDTYCDNCQPFAPWPEEEELMIHREDIYPVKAYVNRRYSFGSFVAYIGMSAGYVHAGQSNIMSRKNDLNPGYSVGFQVGGIWYFSKHWGVNIDVAGDHISMGAPLNATDYEARKRVTKWSLPATIGLRARF